MKTNFIRIEKKIMYAIIYKLIVDKNNVFKLLSKIIYLTTRIIPLYACIIIIHQDNLYFVNNLIV